MVIKDKFNATDLGNKKYIVFTELGTFGGVNYVLPFMFLGMAGVVFIILIVFFAFYCMKVRNRNIYSDSYLETLSY